MRWARGLLVLVLLTFVGFFWLAPVDGPRQLGRTRLPLDPERTVSLPLTDLLILAFLLGCIAVMAWCQRRNEARHEVLVFLGAWCGVVAAVLQFHAIRRWVWRFDKFSLPEAPFEQARLFLLASIALSSIGLLSCLLRRRRRGTVIGACGLSIVLVSNYWVDHFILAPNWVQPYGRPAADGLALAPTSLVSMRAITEEWSYLNLRVENGRTMIEPVGPLLTKREYPDCLLDYVADMHVRTLEWRGRTIERRRGVLMLRPTPDVPVVDLLRVVEDGRRVGIERFGFRVLNAPPHIEGDLFVSVRSPFFTLESAPEYGFTLRPPDEAVGESEVRIHDGEREGTRLTDFIERTERPDPGLVSAQWPRVTLYLDPALRWQQLAGVLDDLNTWIVFHFLELLEEPAPR